MCVLFVYKLGFRQGDHVQTEEGLPGGETRVRVRQWHAHRGHGPVGRIDKLFTNMLNVSVPLTPPECVISRFIDLFFFDKAN